MDIGIDRAWTTCSDDEIFTGVFFGYGKINPNIPNIDGDITTDAPYGGIYGTWLNECGVYIDAVAKAQRFNNHFNIPNVGLITPSESVDYHQWGVSVSAEVGKRFYTCCEQQPSGFFIEPEAQVAYTHVNSANYNAADLTRITISDANVLQARGILMLGYTLNQCGTFFEPYVKIGEASQNTNGGNLNLNQLSDLSYQPNLDGARTEIGAGFSYRVADNLQVHLDYVAATGQDYNIPWAINAGIRYIM